MTNQVRNQNDETIQKTEGHSLPKEKKTLTSVLSLSTGRGGNWAGLAAASFFVAIGLCACTAPAPPVGKGYYGATLTLEQLVGRINENNEKITTLSAREHFEGTIVDRARNKSARIDGYGNLLYTGPNQMKLTAKNEVVDLFEMGSDGRRFWLDEKHDQVFWWGDYSTIGNMDAAEIPVRPDMVMEILGVRPVDPFLLHEPAPAMRFNNFADAYMVDWQEPVGDHWAVAKEIWYDRQTLLPQKVLLFDANGRVALWAKLSNYVRMKMPYGGENQWPWVASGYQLSFPYTGTTIAFELSDVSLSHNGFPNAATYRMPDPEMLSQSGVRVNHIDAQNGQ